MVEKEIIKKKVEKKSLQSPPTSPKLTFIQKEYLRLITEEFLTIDQIATRRNVSIQAVYKIVQKLRDKGALTITNEKVEKNQWYQLQKDKTRLHAQEFNIKILWQDQFYQKNLRKSNVFYLDGNLIKLYRNSVEIFSSQSFFGKDNLEADRKGNEYWNKFFRRLENDLKVILIKNRAKNIKEVKREYAHTDSEVYENTEKHKDRIMVYAEEDGKLAFLTDDSWQFNEDEFVHTETAKQDRGFADKHINDWRLKNPPTQSELAQGQAEIGQNIGYLSKVVSEQGKMVLGLPNVLNRLEKQINSHLSLIQEYRKENKAWRKEKVKEIQKEVKYGRQTKIDDFK